MSQAGIESIQARTTPFYAMSPPIVNKLTICGGRYHIGFSFMKYLQAYPFPAANVAETHPCRAEQR